MLDFSAMKATMNISLFALLLFFIAMPNALLASELAQKGSMARKFQRGIANVALSPMEVTREMERERTRGELEPSWLAGAGRGILFMVIRALAGTYEVLTAPIPLPANYEPVVYPEFPWELLDESEK